MPFAQGPNGTVVHNILPNPPDLKESGDTSQRPFPNLGFNHNKSRYHEEPRPFRVICIGAGFSGVYLGVRLPMLCPDVQLAIYEKNDKIGGTWYENKYPGVACDIPAHRYSYQFELNPKWTNFYAGSDEIQEYIEFVANKYKATDYIKLKHKIIAAEWDEDNGVWNVTIEDPNGKQFKDSANLLINAAGPLNNWKWPDIPDREKFRGKMLHSAAYDRSYDLNGKSVGVIGSGSSSIQIVATAQPQVKELGAYIRSNTWIIPPWNNDQLKKDADGNFIFEYSEEEIEAFTKDPLTMIRHREALEKDVTSGFHLLLKDTDDQEKVRNFVANSMREKLSKKPELIEKLIPNWYVGCKRATPGVGYLESLCEDNVNVIMENIKCFTEDGIMTVDGKEQKYDAIICATGFNVSHVPRFKLSGRNGHTVGEGFAQNPYSYFSIAMQGFPNYFMFNGPSAPIGQGSLVPASEQEGDYICKVVNKMRRQDIKSIQIKDESIEHFTRYADRWLEDSVWAGGCRSWYKNHTINGRVSSLWGGTGLHFVEALQDPRWEDYEYTYLEPNCKYSYFNAGFTQVEMTGGNRNVHMLNKIGVMKDHPRLTEQEREEKRQLEKLAQMEIRRFSVPN